MATVSGPAATKNNPTSTPQGNQQLQQQERTFFCVSPDYCVNTSEYWLGIYDATTATFDLEGAQGPFKLDLGDILYAPNLLQDNKVGGLGLWYVGGPILWGNM
jgi:hypothetical protein